MIRGLKLGIIMCLLQGMLLSVFAKDYYITDFGAKADGVTVNTRIIQRAVDFVSENGGGRIIFTPGSFVTGTFYLKSNVTLHLEGGASLLGSNNPWDYVIDPKISKFSLYSSQH